MWSQVENVQVADAGGTSPRYQSYERQLQEVPLSIHQNGGFHLGLARIRRSRSGGVFGGSRPP